MGTALAICECPDNLDKDFPNTFLEIYKDPIWTNMKIIPDQLIYYATMIAKKKKESLKSNI